MIRRIAIGGIVTVVFLASSSRLISIHAKTVSHVASKPVKASSSAKTPQNYTVPILMYHYIRDHVPKRDVLGAGLSVSPENFEKQLQLIESKKFTTIGFADLKAGRLSAKPIILSFDDGYDDAFLAALPLLIKHHMKGVFYVVPGFIGKPGYLTWNQIKLMKRRKMEIAAHTMTHADLSRLSVTRQIQELGGSILSLQKALHFTVSSCAYPYGRYTLRTVKVAAEVHCPYAVTTHGGIAKAHMNPLLLPRVRMKNATPLDQILTRMKSE